MPNPSETDDNRLPNATEISRRVFALRNQLRAELEAYVQASTDDDDHDLLEAFRKFERVARNNKC